MKKFTALPSKYLAKEDFEKPIQAKIARVEMEEIQSPNGGKDEKPVLYLNEPSGSINVKRGIILNITNWDAVEEITGENDSDNWVGHRIEIYHDPSVNFGGKRVGGIRIRAPRSHPELDEPPPPSEVSPTIAAPF